MTQQLTWPRAQINAVPIAIALFVCARFYAPAFSAMENVLKYTFYSLYKYSVFVFQMNSSIPLFFLYSWNSGRFNYKSIMNGVSFARLPIAI